MRISKNDIFVPILVAIGVLAGMGREIILAYLFGTSRDVEIFRVAFGLPSILSDGLAVSFVSILIPVLIASKQFNKSADRLRHALLATCVVGGSVLLIGLITMPLQARLLAPGILDTDRETLIFAGRLCWGMFFAVMLSLPFRAWMSVNGRLWPGASASFVRSSTFILGLLLLSSFMGVSTTAAAAAALLAGYGVLTIHFLALKGREKKLLYIAVKTWKNSHSIKLLAYALLLVFVTQILISGGRILDRAITSNMGEGSLAAVEYSYGLLMAAAGVIAATTNLIIAPKLGKAFQTTKHIPMNFWKLIMVVSCGALVMGIILSLLAPIIVQLVFQNGAFDAISTATTAAIFRIHALSLGPLVTVLILTQVLLLSGNQKSFLAIAIIKVIVKVLVIWVLLMYGLGLTGIAISLGLTELITMVIVVGYLRHKNLIFKHSSN